MSKLLIIALYAVGLIAVVVEIFIPGVIIGVCGVGCVVVGVIWAYRLESHLLGHVLLIIALVAFPALLFLWYRVVSTKFSISASEAGFKSAKGDLDELLSAEGTTVTTLRPSGIANIGGRRVDVITAGEMIPKNTRIQVIEVKGNRVVVRPMKT
ncbi:MAG TPA: NfeD family protein [Candidatus Brocadiia bacterium]|nr:NfeD family protein [Candidatus Brocadiales bacterium]